MSQIIRAVKHLEPRMVNEDDIERFRCLLRVLPDAYKFRCTLCGAERTVFVPDPSVMNSKSFECKDATPPSNCVKLSSPPTHKREEVLLPGSIVLAKAGHRANVYWPAMIDTDPMERGTTGVPSFVHLGKVAGIIKSYFVNYIFRNLELTRYQGSWVEADQLKPFQPNDPVDNNPRATASFGEAMALARELYSKRLKDRLLQFSFYARVARSRNYDLSEAPDHLMDKHGFFRSARPSGSTQHSRLDDLKPQITLKMPERRYPRGVVPPADTAEATDIEGLANLIVGWGQGPGFHASSQSSSIASGPGTSKREFDQDEPLDLSKRRRV